MVHNLLLAALSLSQRKTTITLADEAVDPTLDCEKDDYCIILWHYIFKALRGLAPKSSLPPDLLFIIQKIYFCSLVYTYIYRYFWKWSVFWPPVDATCHFRDTENFSETPSNVEELKVFHFFFFVAKTSWCVYCILCYKCARTRVVTLCSVISYFF